MRDRPKRPTRRKVARKSHATGAVAPLEFDPFTPGKEHPEWVRKNFPTYVEHQHENLVRSDRVLEHRGSTITITTMYEVRVEGRLVTLHMMVDEEGRLWSHLCPYLTFATATELVLHLLERMPHLFEATPPTSREDEARSAPPAHSGHDHHHPPARRRGGGR